MKVPSIKIFVTLGTQKFAFDRLLIALDQMVNDGIYNKDEVLVQVKTLNYVPQHLTCTDVLRADLFEQYVDNAELIITHAGEYSIMTCLKRGKPFIIVPRLKKYGEHVDDNQLEIATIMKKKYDVLVLNDMESLARLVEIAQAHKYKPWSNDNSRLINSIRSKVK